MDALHMINPLTRSDANCKTAFPTVGGKERKGATELLEGANFKLRMYLKPVAVADAPPRCASTGARFGRIW